MVAWIMVVVGTLGSSHFAVTFLIYVSKRDAGCGNGGFPLVRNGPDRAHIADNSPTMHPQRWMRQQQNIWKSPCCARMAQTHDDASENENKEESDSHTGR